MKAGNTVFDTHAAAHIQAALGGVLAVPNKNTPPATRKLLAKLRTASLQRQRSDGPIGSAMAYTTFLVLVVVLFGPTFGHWLGQLDQVAQWIITAVLTTGILASTGPTIRRFIGPPIGEAKLQRAILEGHLTTVGNPAYDTWTLTMHTLDYQLTDGQMMEALVERATSSPTLAEALDQLNDSQITANLELNAGLLAVVKREASECYATTVGDLGNDSLTIEAKQAGTKAWLNTLDIDQSPED